jgi:dethiobiotin synthetase/adenosylmethionine--8-amino-7-oxononanoate aminotransferase
MQPTWSLLLAGHRRLSSRNGLRWQRAFSASSPADQGRIPLSHPSLCVWGANTGVGKTLVSAGLAAAALRAQVPPALLTASHGPACESANAKPARPPARPPARRPGCARGCLQKHVLYLKPVQTGYPADSDARLVVSACPPFRSISCHWLPRRRPQRDGAPAICNPLQENVCDAAGSNAGGSILGQARLTSRVLHTYSDPVGPHLAATQEGRVIPDAQLVSDTRQQLQQFAARLPPGAGALSIVETAGGVASPGPSGSLQVRRAAACWHAGWADHASFPAPTQAGEGACQPARARARLQQLTCARSAQQPASSFTLRHAPHPLLAAG